MRITSTVHFVWIAITLAAPGWAKVGDSVQEVLARYGKANLAPPPMHRAVIPWTEPSPEKKVPRWFYYEDLVVWVLFYRGQVVGQSYMPRVGVLSRKQVDRFLAESAEGFTWKVTQKNSSGTNWLRSDGKLKARLSYAPPGLRFEAVEDQLLDKESSPGDLPYNGAAPQR